MTEVLLGGGAFNSVISAEALLMQEDRRLDVFVHAEIKRETRRVWARHALHSQGALEALADKSYGAVRKWAERGQFEPVRSVGTARFYDVGHIEHLLQTREFPRGDDLCEEAWRARAFFAWVPRDGLPNEPGSPADRISQMPFMRDLYDFVRERLAEVAALRRAVPKQAKTASAAKPKKRTA